MDPADELLAADVMRMRLPAEDDLDRTDRVGDLEQALRIRDHQVGALVRCGAARKANCEDFGVELCSAACLDLVEEHVLRVGVSLPNLLERDTDGVAQVVVVRAPFGDPPIEQGLKRRRGPR